MNTNLQSLITMQQTTEATSALQLVGKAICRRQLGDAVQRDQRSGRLEPHHLDARQRHRPGHEFVRFDRLQQHVVAQRRNAELHSEAPGQ